MFYIIDNYDSFVYNLAAYLEENGHETVVRRADAFDVSEVLSLNPEGIIISPGPKRPEDADVSNLLLTTFENKIPILGICLGHQVIGYHYGARVLKGMHGKLSDVFHDGEGVFKNLPQGMRVTRYHSLVVSEENLPDDLVVTARSEDGVCMGIRHKTLPIYGVQFHPEAVLSEYGHEILENFVDICRGGERVA